MAPRLPSESKTKLLDTALQLIRARGYAATTVDDLCKHAGVTKGSFFHHFKSKDELATSAIGHFSAMAEGFFASAPYHAAPDPLERLLGTMVQETYATHPDLRAACDLGMSAHIAELTREVQAAKDRYAPDAPWSAESVAYFIQSVLQGSFIFAKAKQGPQVAHDSLAHLRRYLKQLFDQAPTNEKDAL